MERPEHGEASALNLFAVACFVLALSAFAASIFVLIELILAEYSYVEQNALLRLYLS
ncbi:MAG TPA: hypothetical protein VJQ56_00150 [Blastocatellia bacterium]|nr:hypothetical protein [Blastocatellia bacterium]